MLELKIAHELKENSLFCLINWTKTTYRNRTGDSVGFSTPAVPPHQISEFAGERRTCSQQACCNHILQNGIPLGKYKVGSEKLLIVQEY